MSNDDISKTFEELVIRALNRLGSEGEEARMVAQHGELVSPKKAAELLNKSTATIYRYCEAGHLVDNGHGITVRSIYQFLQRPKALQAPRKTQQKPCDFERVVP